jgi:hypothetical protein
MPQLDQFTYLSQFFWLCIFFFGYYVLLLNNGLPKIARVLKLRSYLQRSDSSSSSQSQLSNVDNSNAHNDNLNTEIVNKTISYYNSSLSSITSWCNKIVTDVNRNTLNPINKFYIHYLTEMTISQILNQNILLTSYQKLNNGIASHASKQTGREELSLFHRLNTYYLLRLQKISNGSVKNGQKKRRTKNA